MSYDKEMGHASPDEVISHQLRHYELSDVAVLSKYCMCQTKLKDNCEANYNGASGGMGVASMKKNFHRFLLWYVNFLSADLKAFSVGHL
jgi:hypothetical protein